MTYHSEYIASISDPEEFWKSKANALPWFTLPQRIIAKDINGIDRWFVDGTMNTSYMALDHHVNLGRGEQVALFYDSPVTNTKQAITYAELLRQVALFAGVLQRQGVKHGDRVVIYMPMIPEAIVAMLATARLGAIHSVVFGGFAAPELAVRIDDALPNVIVSASCGIEINRIIEYKPLLDKAVKLAVHKPKCIIIKQRSQTKAHLLQPLELDWDSEITSASPVEALPLKATDPLYILYTSGTTGKPKGLVRDNGSHAVALYYSMHALYNMQAGNVFWAASDVGWVVGHSYIVYGPLLAGCSSILYEGKPVRTPDAGAFWRVCQEYAVKTLFAAPTAFRAIKKEDPDGKLIKEHDLASLQAIFMAGERLDPSTYHWTKQITRKEVFDHWWQTETGWAICGNYVGLQNLPVKPGSVTKPSPGYQVQILGESGEVLPPNKQGMIVVKRPLPPGYSPTIWGNFSRFKTSYLSDYPGYYNSGDLGYFDEYGYLFVMGRIDDVINVAGHRLSTGEMEEVVAKHFAVAECCVIGVKDSLKGQLPIGLIILKDTVEISEEQLQAELIEMVNMEIGRIACFQQAFVVPRLPKTRSGKIQRKVLRLLADGQQYSVPSTIDDPAILTELEALMKRKGLI
jgi:propionyl-CoA synthetase